MYFGTEYLSNVKDEALLKRLLPFTINDMYPNWSTFISLCFDLTDFSSEEVKVIVKKYSKRPPLRTIEYYCKKYHVKRNEIFIYCIWLYFMIGYKRTTTLKVRQMAAKVFSAPFEITNLVPGYYPYNIYADALSIFNKRIKTNPDFFKIEKGDVRNMFWEGMFLARETKNIYVVTNRLHSFGRKKNWVVPSYLLNHKAEFDAPFNFNPLDNK